MKNHPNEALDGALDRLYQPADVPAGFETGWRAAVRREESVQAMKKTNFSFPWKRLIPAAAAIVLVAGSLWAGSLDLHGVSAPSDAAPMMRAAVTSTAASKQYAEEASYDTAADYGAPANGLAAAGGVSIPAQPEAERKLVRTADMTLRTQRFDEAQEQIKALLTEKGGYIESLYQYGESARRLSLSMRVPADQLDAFLSGMEGMGRVTDRSESVTDMTLQYADNAARLQTLYAKRDRLNDLLKQAAEVSDLIEIESAIADTQYQIDSYETSQRHIDSRVSMSAVNVTLMEDTAADTAQAEISFGQRIRAAFSASVEWTGEFLRDMAVFVIIILPVAVPLALIIGVILWIRKRRKV